MPCPFCSGPAKLIGNAGWSNPDIGGSACVICTSCGAGGPCIENDNERMTQAMVERRAIRLWNKRGNLAGAEVKLRRIAQILNS